MSESKLAIGVIIGSTRPGRLGEKVAAWFTGLAREVPELAVHTLDLRDFPLPFFDQPKSAKVAEAQYPAEVQRRWVEAIRPLDGYVLVTPEYNHGYPAALKNALDHVYAGWNAKPVAFVSYGGTSGGTRSVQQLRQVVVELQMVPLRDEVNIPFAARALDESGKPKDPFFTQRAEQLLNGLLWWSRALAEARQKYGPPGAVQK